MDTEEQTTETEEGGGGSRWVWPLTIALAALILGGAVWLGGRPGAATPTPAPLSLLAEPTKPVTPTQTISAATPTIGELVVYVSGAVATPGVYRLPGGARGDDAVRAAGGLTGEADAGKVNLAARLKDETHLYIPQQGELGAPPAQAPGAADPGDGKVNLNTAGLAELDTLPRIGPATAQRILDHRAAHGPFATIEDLRKVKGIGAATFDGLKELITVGP